MIIILISLLLIVFLVIYLRKETFLTIEDVVNNKNRYLDTIDTSMKDDEFVLNLDNIDPTGDLITNFLDKYIIKKQVKTNNPTDLPIMGNSTMSSYNHQLKKINNSKKIKQDFILNALKGKINILLESLKDLEIK
jgi:hypothetical protein